MSVKVHLHPDMCHLADNNETIRTEGKTIKECVDRITNIYPGLYDLIFYKDGCLQTFIEIYLNRKAVIPNDLNHFVQDGDEIHLIMATAGG